MGFPFHLAGGNRIGGCFFVGADAFMESLADRQVVDIIIAGYGMILALQRAQVELVAALGVTNPAVITWEDTF